MIHRPAFGLEQPAHLCEAVFEVVQSYVLKDAHTGDAIKGAIGQVAVVLQTDFDAILQTCFSNPCLRQLKLFV